MTYTEKYYAALREAEDCETEKKARVASLKAYYARRGGLDAISIQYVIDADGLVKQWQLLAERALAKATAYAFAAQREGTRT